MSDLPTSDSGNDLPGAPSARPTGGTLTTRRRPLAPSRNNETSRARPIADATGGSRRSDGDGDDGGGQRPERRGRRDPRRALAVSAIGLALLLALQFTVTRAVIENSIENRVVAAERRAGFPGVGVEVDGVDVVLDGLTSTLAEAVQATRIAKAQEGVHDVTSTIVVDPSALTAEITRNAEQRRADAEKQGFDVPEPTPQPTLPATPSLVATIEDGRISLAGVVGTQDSKNALLAVSRRVFGADAVTDAVLVEADGGTAGLAALNAAIGALDETASGTFRVQLGTLNVSGSVGSIDEHDRLLAAARVAMRDPANVTDNLVVLTKGPNSELITRLSALPSPAFTGTTAALTSGGAETVQDIATALKEFPDASVTIVAHVDTTESSGSDRRLSQRRADAVRDRLIADGVASDRLTAVAKGSSDPLVEGTSANTRSANTRIDVTVDS